MSSSLQLSLDRYFWVLNLVFLLGASYFSARTINVIVGDKLLPAPKAATAAPGAARDAESQPLSKEAFARLMGMELPDTPDVALDGPGGADAQERPTDMTAEPIRSSLHAQLMATVIANQPEWSLCTLRDLTANETSVYMIDDEFMGATIYAIEDLKVIVVNNGHREYIDLEEPGKEAPAPLAAATPAKATADGIKKLDEHHYQIERSTVNNALSNLNDLAMQARIVPSFKNGQANGFKLFSIRPDSLYTKIGVVNGDVIQRINGFDINSPDKALEAYTKLRNAGSIDLQVDRGGQTVSYHYAIQ